ncbi:MAG: lipid-A-disaccharide synthase [Pyrinomonas sp.]|uniref:lipid-A-disaccharide synthase n=1 Tax=Pyrinomonas sp. TaxID=2080306 RepID=UPI00331B5B33
MIVLLAMPTATKNVTETFRLMLVAGEASGDAHAAALVAALRQTAPEANFEFFGRPGPRMRACGVEPTADDGDLAIMGIFEVARALPRFWRTYQQLRETAYQRRPDAAILVDWPEFNLRLARALRRAGVRVIYYISPQLWAWREGRVRYVARDIDLLLSILPFELPWYAARGISHVEFVGHPLVGEVRAGRTRAEFCRAHALDPTRPLIALLPGSRRKELQRILPPMLDAAFIIERCRKDAQFVVALAPSRTRAELMRLTAERTRSPRLLRIVHDETYDALAAADVAAVASGTATLEAMLLETPLVIVYRESSINWHTLGRLIRTDDVGLVNLIAEKRIAPELIQNDFAPENLARHILALLDPVANGAMRAELRAAKAKLGTDGASARAAQAIIQAVRRWRSFNQAGTTPDDSASPAQC